MEKVEFTRHDWVRFCDLVTTPALTISTVTVITQKLWKKKTTFRLKL